MKSTGEQGLIKQVSQTVDRVGLKKTMQVLKGALDNSADGKADLIIKITCQTFGVPASKIINKFSTRPKNNESEALMCIIVFLDETKQYSLREISNFINRSTGLCCKYIKRFHQLSPKHPVDSDILDKFQLAKSKLNKSK